MWCLSHIQCKSQTKYVELLLSNTNDLNVFFICITLFLEGASLSALKTRNPKDLPGDAAIPVMHWLYQSVHFLHHCKFPMHRPISMDFKLFFKTFNYLVLTFVVCEGGQWGSIQSSNEWNWGMEIHFSWWIAKEEMKNLFRNIAR